MDVKTAIACTIVGMALGVAVSAIYNSDSSKAVAAVKVEQKDTAKSLAKAVVEDQKLGDKLTTNATTAKTVTAAVHKQLSKGVKHAKPTAGHASDSQVCNLTDGSSLMPFTVGTVRLLNDYREGKPVDPTSHVYAEGETAAGITVEQFTDNDTEIVKAYNDLAAKHNALVDSVSDFMKKQAEERQ